MNSKNFWHLFMETGSPELYMLYSHVKKLEESRVPDSQGIDTESYQL